MTATTSTRSRSLAPRSGAGAGKGQGIETFGSNVSPLFTALNPARPRIAGEISVVLFLAHQLHGRTHLPACGRLFGDETPQAVAAADEKVRNAGYGFSTKSSGFMPGLLPLNPYIVGW